MKKSHLFVWIILLTLFNLVFSKYIEIANTVPDVLFAFVLCYAISAKRAGDVIVVSTVCGIINDCATGRVFGNYTAIYLICAVIAFIADDLLYKDGYLTGIGIVFIVSILGETIFYIMNISVLQDAGYLYSFFYIILPEAIYNTVISALLLFAVKKQCSHKKAGILR